MTTLNAEQLEKVLRRVSNQQPSPDEYLKEVQSAVNFYSFNVDASNFIEQVVHRAESGVDVAPVRADEDADEVALAATDRG